MDKRYQVFVSSTYNDLKDERQKVIQTLMQMDCIPSSMEFFPAADEDQFEFIKKVIDDCDYYLLVIGGRYGSTTSEGVSYTELEYDYAKQKGMKIVALLHGKPDDIVVSKTDKDFVLLERLNSFRKKAEGNRLVKYWEDSRELPGLVALSLAYAIKTYPAVGWMRASNVGSTQLLEEINTLRKQNDELCASVSAQKSLMSTAILDIAGMDEKISLHGTVKKIYNGSTRGWEYLISWNQLFSLISPHLIKHPTDSVVKDFLISAVLKLAGIDYTDADIEDQDFQTIMIQLKAYGLIDVRYVETTQGGMALFWSLTEKGESSMIHLRAVRKLTDSI